MIRIDSHQHFWNYSAEEYGWIQPGSKIEQSFAPKDLKPLLDACQLDGCIAVQARQSLAENDYLCDLAKENDFIAGVVGWIDLQSTDAQDQASHFSEQTRALGVRHVVQDERDPHFMARPAFRNGISHLHSLGLVYDILIFEHQLTDASELVKAFPNQIFVVDHIAKPKIISKSFDSWFNGMKALSQFPNVTVKVSGIITEANHDGWTRDDLDPYWHALTDLFSPERLMFGSDWPVLRLAGEYQGWYELVMDWTKNWSSSERESLFGGTANRIYRLDRQWS